ncbi:hypothetical protein DPMN_082834 [Dreissena polymorpha]|uniref:Uncharacterized protein n=1 Tax=Dreissena polymorpha TaxID=45954 RepID=A0A9D4BHP0_DREPO|nr:hypothetical protein DPMN_082834 [Dreissena polymorpha]
MARIHTIENDITFEKIRHFPRRTRVCSIHRQLSWACQKEIQLYEKDTRVTTGNINRSKTAIQGRFKQLNVAKQKIGNEKGTNVMSRSTSCPAELLRLHKEQSQLVIARLQSRFLNNSSKDTVSNVTRAQTLPVTASFYVHLSSDRNEVHDTAIQDTIRENS